MIEQYGRIWLIVCPLIFLAGFIDSIAGGGGLISLPTYLFAGLPAHYAHGTGKFSSCFGLMSSSLKYIKEGKVNVRVAIFSAIGCMVGAGIGTRLALLLPERVFRIVMVAALPVVAIFLFTRKDFGTEKVNFDPLPLKKEMILSAVIGLVVGIYDGLVGPGAGTFLIIGFTGVLGIDLLMASGCAKVSNMASNLTSMAMYMLGGKVLYAVAIPAAVSSIVGNYFGARFAIKGGAKNVRKMMFVVLALLFSKLAYDLFQGL